MKKLVLSFAMIVIAMTTSSFAQVRIAPCTLSQYPRLYSGLSYDNKILPNGDKVAYVTMTIPLTHVVYAEGIKYYVIYPIAGNECIDQMSTINDVDNDLEKLFQLAHTYPNAVPEISVVIQQKSINGKANEWIITGSSTPMYPEDLIFKK